MAVNLVGLGVSLRQAGAVNRVALPPGGAAAVVDELRRREGEPEEHYLWRLTRGIHRRFTHVDTADYRVPMTENWVLGGLSHILPTFARFEWSDEERAIERGTGVCTQILVPAFEILHMDGFQPRAVLLRAHSVAEVGRGSRRWIVDPDFGVLMPHSFAEVRNDPSIIRPYYEGIDPEDSPLPTGKRERLVAEVEAAYRSELLDLRPKIAPRRELLEIAAYPIKWLVPILLLSWSAIQAIVRRRPSSKSTSGS
jgi:hypothetical protein